MKIFNLQSDEWHETRDRDGWRMREAFVGHHIGGELIGASMCEVEPGNKMWRIMLARRGPTLEYWAAEE
jgi:lipid II:glycine glycyltransferase (peptidoglycan interpeptide bridge formation enzyme)